VNVPYAHDAFVSPEKLTDYLLSETHPVGKAKAQYFRGYGYEDTMIPQLIADLKHILQTNPIAKETPSPFGTKYQVCGTLRAPSGTALSVCTVWIIESARRIRVSLQLIPNDNMENIKEHNMVVLMQDLPTHGLSYGDVGTVVHCYPTGLALEAEFVTGEGQTIAIVTLDANHVRRMQGNDILHVRDLAA